MNAKAPCPMTNPELISCRPDEKIVQIIDPNGCLIWSCVTGHPYCCRRAPPPATLCAGDESSSLNEVMDPKTGCFKWACVPKQPRCCAQTHPKKCKKNFYSGEVHDPKTGCLIWTCIPCPNIGEKIKCSYGYPVESIGFNGCPLWSCLGAFIA